MGHQQGTDAVTESPGGPLPVCFISDSTAITAETLGNALLVHFPEAGFVRRTFSFVDSAETAGEVVRQISEQMPQAVVFMTVRNAGAAAVLTSGLSNIVDLLSEHLNQLERILGMPRTEGDHAHHHGMGDTDRYHARMRAVEFAVEHDDGQSLRMLELADLIILAPSRCGKTPTALYLALQHGLRVANYPLTEDDYPGQQLPGPVRPYSERCFGLTSSANRLSQVRQQRRPGSPYASLEQCRRELLLAETLYGLHQVPFLNSQNKSVEEIAAVILQRMGLRQPPARIH